MQTCEVFDTEENETCGVQAVAQVDGTWICFYHLERDDRP